MTDRLKRGQVWLADLNPTQGSEQAGVRPVIIFQNDLVSQFSTTTIAIPLSTNQRRAALPICLLIEQGNPMTSCFKKFSSKKFFNFIPPKS